MTDTDDQIDRLAEAIRDMYWEERIRYEGQATGRFGKAGDHHAVRWDGGEDVYGRRYEPIWPKIAKRLIKDFISPERAIRAVFMTAHGTSAPLPNVLLGKNLARTVEVTAENRFEEIKRQANVEVEYAKTHIILLMSSYTETQSQRLAIVSSEIQLTPLFRFCLAVKFGHFDLAEKYRERAFNQFINDAECYRQIFQDGFIPAEFDTRLAELRTAVRSAK
jgi:hypothetical protein